MGQEKIYKNRMGMFDFIKGVSIFGVIFIHTLEFWINEAGYDLLYGVAWVFGLASMPVFVMASAYWYREQEVKIYNKRQVKNYFFPTIITQMISWICFAGVHYTKWRYLPDTVKASFGLVVGTLLENRREFWIGDLLICNIGPAWFVIALFLGGILFNYVMIQKRWENKVILIAVLAVVGLCLGWTGRDIYCISTALVIPAGFYTGYWLRKSNFLTRRWEKKEYYCLILVASIGYLMKDIFQNNNNAMTNNLVLGIPLGVLGLRLGLYLAKNKDNFLVRVFTKLGRYCFWILLVHTVEVISIDWRWFKEWHVLQQISPYLTFWIVLVIRLSLITCGCFAVAQVNKIWVRITENVVSEHNTAMES